MAHWYGDFTFDDSITPRDSIVTGVITLGEGYHNFHHEFPNDYRNGVHWYDYDPTKWLISAAEAVGLAYGLKQFPMNEIRRGKLDMQLKRLKEQMGEIDYGVPLQSLPKWKKAELDAAVADGRVVVIAHGVVYDMTDFLKRDMHPGGRKMVVDRNGKDVGENEVTHMFWDLTCAWLSIL